MNLQKYKEQIRLAVVVWLFLYLAGILSFDGSTRVSLLDRDLNADQAVGAASNALKIIIWVSMLFLSAMLAWWNRSLLRSAPAILLPLGPVLIFCVLSAFWSDYPDLTIKRVIFQFILIGTVAFLAASFETEEQFVAAMTAAGVVTLMIQMAVMVIFPAAVFDMSHSFVGFQKSKNNTGILAAIFATHFFMALRQSRAPARTRFYLVMTAAWGLVLLASQSKTSIACTAVVIALSVLSRPVLVGAMRGAVVFVSGAYVYLMVRHFGSNDDLRTTIGNVFGDMSLTGRVEIWKMLSRAMERNLMFGHGYGAFWGVGAVNPDTYVRFSFINALNSGHNGYIDLTLAIGFVGALLFIFWLLILAFHFSKRLSLLAISTIFISAIHNITESSYMRDTHIIWFALLLIVTSSYVVDTRRAGRVSAQAPGARIAQAA